MIAQSQEDLDKISARAAQLQKDLNQEYGAKVNFEP